MKLYNEDDSDREKKSEGDQDYRTPFRRDYARVIHTAGFRRLQGKTQMFPGAESDSFRNRLTHSLEVAQIAKSIAQRINSSNEYFIKNPISEDIVEFAGLTHDIGHPPFGHVGENALDELMCREGGFEGNAQTLRILTKIEKKEIQNGGELFIDQEDNRIGLNLTYRSLASILKYDKQIDYKRTQENRQVEKGYYTTEKNLVTKIKEKVTGKVSFSDEFKTIECQIMDIADDIAYSVYDLEDAFKANFITPISLLTASGAVLDEVCRKVNKAMEKDEKMLKDGPAGHYDRKDIEGILQNFFSKFINDSEIIESVQKQFQNNNITKESLIYVSNIVANVSNDISNNGYSRVAFTSSIVNDSINAISVELCQEIPALSKIKIDKDTKERIEVLKNFTYVYLVMSPILKVPEYMGYDIIKTIYETLSDNKHGGTNLLPNDYKFLHDSIKSELKPRIICDFISGMTDRYAVEFYGRIKSINPQSIFKRI